MLFYKAIERDTLGLLKKILSKPELKGTRLVGGTALSLQLGHRESIDLDFFGEWATSVNLLPVLEGCGDTNIESEGQNIFIYTVSGVKCDFVRYKYQWLKPPLVVDGLRLAHTDDIVAMKLEAITGRGSRKDFIDLAFLLERYTLVEMLTLYREKYPQGSEYLVLRSLAYFDDAEDDPTPKMLKPFTWEEVKERISKAVREVAIAQ